MTLRRYEYGNPLEILIQREARKEKKKRKLKLEDIEKLACEDTN